MIRDMKSDAVRLKSIAALSLLCAAVLLPTLGRAQSIPESVYPPPEPYLGDEPRDMQTGFRFALDVRYLTDYVWRGIDRFDAGRNEDEPNLQFQTRIGFDLGKLPHPYVDLFVNVTENDPISSFQEVRPEIGFDWNVRPLMISAGYTTYIFPDNSSNDPSEGDRSDFDTNEVFFKLAFDDSLLFRSERPIFNPYVLAAYDIDTFEGLYLEAGVNHTLPIENTGLSFTANAHAAYVNGNDLFQLTPDNNSGFQHWQVGLTAKYNLNTLLNIPDRFGQISVNGYIHYTDSIDEDLLATDQLWGGAGFSLKF